MCVWGGGGGGGGEGVEVVGEGGRGDTFDFHVGKNPANHTVSFDMR